MDWEFLTGGPPPQTQLLHGCFLEAERADRVAQGLDGLRSVLDESLHEHLTALIEEIRQSGILLRELAGRSRVHMPRAPIVSNHLNVVLPCMSRSLRDITVYYDDKTISRDVRWRKMYHEMTKEAGVALPQRFVMYNHFMTLLLCLLTKDKNFEPVAFDTIRKRILDLRERRGIPAPKQAAPVLDMINQETTMVPGQPPMRERPHWAERVFSRPPSSRTDMRGPDRSRAMPPFLAAGDRRLPAPARMLMRRSFNNDRLCVMIILNAENDSPYVVLRVYNGGTELFSSRGIHEICVRQDGNSLVLKRWSFASNRGKTFAILSFITWEELVLFYCTLVTLKALSHLTVDIDPMGFQLRGEDLLFQAQIIDDGYAHSLIVYQDKRTKGIRLHATVWDGELRQCPVWTAFVTYQSASPTWLVQVSAHKIQIKEVHMYVFCDKYREAHMGQNKAGAFEIYFRSKEAATKFKEVFSTTISEPSEA